MDFKDLLQGIAPRDDREAGFPPDRLEQEQPMLLNQMSATVAALVAARVLGIVARRGGSRIRASAADALYRQVARALPESVRHLCDDEAARVLRWLDEAPAHAQRTHAIPEVEHMLQSELDSRASVVQLALDEGYDLELEYWDADAEAWPRAHARPLELAEPDDDRREASLVLEDANGEFEVPLRHIRWLMPVVRRAIPGLDDAAEPTGGTLLEFPGGD